MHLVRVSLLIIWAVLFLCCAATTTGIHAAQRSNADIEKAFELDGLQVSQWVSFEGQRGARAESKTATVLSTGQPKYVLYVEGSGYQMGYLVGLLAPEETFTMCSQYLEHIIPELIVPDWDHKLANDTTYRAIIDLLRDFMVTESNKSFERLYPQGIFPEELVQEMRGLVDGVQKSSSPSAQVNFKNLVTLNYGMDFLMANILNGKLGDLMASFMDEWEAPRHSEASDPRVQSEMRSFLRSQEESRKAFQVPSFCDAWGARNKATQSGQDAFMARDFQLPTAGVFQNVQSMIIYNPGDGRHPSVSSGAPSFVGSITIMNSFGVSCAEDTLRSADANAQVPGLNSMLMSRHIGDHATSTEEAIEIMANATRGVPWIYPLCDGNGDCVIVESGVSMNSYKEFDPRRFLSVLEFNLQKLLPSNEFILAHNSSSHFDRGLFLRTMDYQYPEEYLQFNEALFENAGIPYNGSNWGPLGSVFSSWQEENTLEKKLMNNYFPPQRETLDDVVIASNVAIVPEARIAQMSVFADLMQKGGEAMQWRYDLINQLIHDSYGQIDLEKAIWLCSYLSPDRVPGYWSKEFIPGKPMTAMIEGSMSVVDLKNRKIATKGGYWCDDWVTIQLMNYI